MLGEGADQQKWLMAFIDDQRNGRSVWIAGHLRRMRGEDGLRCFVEQMDGRGDWDVHGENVSFIGGWVTGRG